MHSPFGIAMQIVKETGWTLHYVLWKVSWATIMLMLADRPSLKKKTTTDGVVKLSKEDAAAMRKQLR